MNDIFSEEAAVWKAHQEQKEGKERSEPMTHMEFMIRLGLRIRETDPLPDWLFKKTENKTSEKLPKDFVICCKNFDQNGFTIPHYLTHLIEGVVKHFSGKEVETSFRPFLVDGEDYMEIIVKEKQQ